MHTWSTSSSDSASGPIRCANAIKLADGSIQALSELPEALRSIYRTAWELPMRSLIDLAADRGAYIDQSQSLNLFMGESEFSGRSPPCTCMPGSAD